MLDTLDIYDKRTCNQFKDSQARPPQRSAREQWSQETIHGSRDLNHAPTSLSTAFDVALESSAAAGRYRQPLVRERVQVNIGADTATI